MTHIDAVGLGLFVFVGLIAHAWIAKITDGPATGSASRVQLTARVVGGLLTVLALVMLLLTMVQR